MGAGGAFKRFGAADLNAWSPSVRRVFAMDVTNKVPNLDLPALREY